MAYIITVLITVILDQLTKILVMANFKVHESRPVIQNIFHFTYVTNRGGAFSLLSKYPLFFKILGLLLVIAGIVYLTKIIKMPTLLQTCLGLLMGGTIGNLIDRFRFDTVVDFLDFRVWPVFNIADIAICVGVGLLVIIIMREKKEEIESADNEPASPPLEADPMGEPLNEHGIA